MTDAEKIAAGLSEGERARILLGRGDWRDEDWQDHCGINECVVCHPAEYLIPINAPPLDDVGLAIRAIIQGETE